MGEVVVFQHDPFEDLGFFAEVLEKHQAAYRVVRLFHDEMPAENWDQVKALIILGGPMNADQGGDAGYIGVHITGSENYFKSCTFGVDTIGRDEASPNVQLGAGTLTIFEDCLFLLSLTDGDPLFVKVLNTSGYT